MEILRKSCPTFFVNSDGQADKVVSFAHGGRGFEFSHVRSFSPLGSPLMASALFLRMMYTISLLMKEVKIRKEYIKDRENTVVVVRDIFP